MHEINYLLLTCYIGLYVGIIMSKGRIWMSFSPQLLELSFHEGDIFEEG
uniref:Uncharacterized protein n=1 Tax=Vitis vinifera TaxID=29760 RepID=F6HYN7_VITVI